VVDWHLSLGELEHFTLLHSLSRDALRVYPSQHGSTIDETKDHMYLSLRSFALLKKEGKFYDLLAKSPHPNIVQRFPSEREDGILLEHMNPIAEA
jgi:hypothetical protein